MFTHIFTMYNQFCYLSSIRFGDNNKNSFKFIGKLGVRTPGTRSKQSSRRVIYRISSWGVALHHIPTGCLGRAIDATLLQLSIIILPSALAGIRTQHAWSEVFKVFYQNIGPIYQKLYILTLDKIWSVQNISVLIVVFD